MVTLLIVDPYTGSKMADFYEVAFLGVDSNKSGDAIISRYSLGGRTYIHVTDGGFQGSGESVVQEINRFFNYPGRIDYVVATHPDGDHTGGLRTILDSFEEIGELWMLRPWVYADELVHRFTRFTSVDGLRKRLRDLYPNLVALEDIAIQRGIPIREPLQGSRIGAYTVMAPTRNRYLDMVVTSERTPETSEERADESEIARILREAIRLVASLWGDENFSNEETSAENEMSVVQYANFQGNTILLTADVGRAGLRETINYAPVVGLALPGLKLWQVPHHGSRRNVSTELLNELIGPKHFSQPVELTNGFAIISASGEDPHHPRKSVIRALHHRGVKPFSTERGWIHWGVNIDFGGQPATPLSYPTEQET